MKRFNYKKSPRSLTNCVLVGRAADGRTAIGDSKLDGGNDQNPILTSPENYHAFSQGVIAGEFDYYTLGSTHRKSSYTGMNCLWAYLLPNGIVALYEDEYPGVVKYYTMAEWDAFVLGVKNKELQYAS